MSGLPHGFKPLFSYQLTVVIQRFLTSQLLNIKISIVSKIEIVFRLNQQAYNILKTEVERLAVETRSSGTEQLNIILQQLKQMRF